MNVLFLANLVPYPLDNGGKIFTFSIIKAVSKKHKVDLLCFYENEDILKATKALEKYCNTITLFPIKVTTKENMPLMMLKAGKSLLSGQSFAISKYIKSEMKKAIQEKMSQTNYDAVIFNLLVMFSYEKVVRKINPDIPCVLYEQNCETQIYKRYLQQTNNFFKKLFLKIEIRKLGLFETRALNKADKLVLLSKEDQIALGLESKNCDIVPIGVQTPIYQKTYQKDGTTTIKLLFVGTMTWAPNDEGMIWFLENVMPVYQNSSAIELYIVGKNPSDKIKNICANYKNIHLMGYVESIYDFYEKCDVLVVPLFIGSGQRVKIIEAFASSFPVISTSIGAEGLQYEDGKTIMIADSKEEFIEKIGQCVDATCLSQIGLAGKAIFDQTYSAEVMMKMHNNILKKLSFNK